MEEWRDLINRSQNGSTESTMRIIKKIEPKIKKSINQTNKQEQEVLEQELKIKTIKIIQTFNLEKIPGFWDFLKK
ncbi:hypothetical protein SAMN05421734_11312 [Pelagirhabdus alkalitolerans]|uniref:Helix-turn-helix conjugative transposon-like domain-containing protein n=1 Tax=Pelagirhabdus alkalitolerans TaxID=1612202 RepID=A0A1G6MZI8_9BACI|nr:helix-turn-helix domain-containing protein [Pelagirhabdus alkalitolerans]SDC60617.1 hypothetical protein SAMN05421734_11312 [Pelagirhabdus alkalitolerans]